MGEPKTKVSTQDPKDFLNTVEPEEKRKDAFTLLEIFSKVTGEKPTMWGPSMIGFGKYHYKSTRSTQEGDWFQVGFSPRKQNLALYIMHGNKNNPDLEKLGKNKASMGCLYVNRLSDIDTKVLERMIEKSYRFMQTATYEDMLTDFHGKN